MNEVPLAQIVQRVRGRAGDEDGLPVYSVTKHAGFVPSLEYFSKQVFSRDTSDYKLVEPGDFAYATIHLDEGSIGIAPERALISPMYTVFRVDETKIAPGYLIRFLKSPRALAQYAVLGKGAIHRRKAISLEVLGSIMVPMPDLVQQRRIAAILGHADALGAQRRQLLAHLDGLTRSIFSDMFGDPVLPKRKLGDLADFRGGSSLPAGEPFLDQSGGVLLMRVSDMNSPGNEKVILQTATWAPKASQASSMVGPGAVIIPKRGASIATNKKRVASRQTALDPNLMGVQPLRDLMTPQFLHAWFRTFDLASITSGSTVPQLNKQDLVPILLPVPSMQQQLVFGERLAKIDRSINKAERALRAHEELFLSLQSRAFRGEL